MKTLAEWCDADIASYHLAQKLGIIAPEVNFSVDSKAVFWTNNILGDVLFEVLLKLAEIGFLEFRDEPDVQFRYDPSFNWKDAAIS